MSNTKVNPDQQHNTNAESKLVGKTIKRVHYLSNKDAENLMWYKRPIVIEFEDGSMIIPQMDDEGNDGGALMYLGADDTHDVIYTI